MVLLDVAEHAHDFGALDFGDRPRAECREYVALEHKPFPVNAAQLFNVGVAEVFILDNPSQRVRARVSLLALIGQGIATAGNLAKLPLCFSPCGRQRLAAIDRHAPGRTIGIPVLDDVTACAVRSHHQAEAGQRSIPVELSGLADRSCGPDEIGIELACGHRVPFPVLIRVSTG
jgi:hypothetical protein